MDLRSICSLQSWKESEIALPITIYTPRALIDKHIELFTLAFALFLIGVIVGLQPEVSQPIIEHAQQMQIDPYDLVGNLQAIFVNNAAISAVTWVGWFIFPIFGFGYFPPNVMLYSIGATFGAVISYISPLQSLLTLASFGIIEASGLIFGMTAGLMFPKYLLMKITAKEAALGDYTKDSLTLFLYSIIALGSGAFTEALLINPVTQPIGGVGGVVGTFFFLKFVFAK